MQKKELNLAANDSPFSIGEVLSHKMEDSMERLIAFTSRLLKHAEKKDAQRKKEGLAFVFSLRSFTNSFTADPSGLIPIINR